MANNTGAMIALMVPDPENYAIPTQDDSTVPASDLHITLGYLGEASEISPEQRAAILDACQVLADTADAPEALFPASTGMFPPDPEAGDDTPAVPHYAAPSNSEVFNSLREDLMIHLAARGVGELVSTKHPVFTPHVTLAYLPMGSQADLSHLAPPMPTRFGTLVARFGDEVHTFELSSPAKGEQLPLTASVQRRLHSLSRIHGISEDYLTALYLRQRHVQATPAQTRAQAALEAVTAAVNPTYRNESFTRVKTLADRVNYEADAKAQAFVASRALALATRTKASSPTEARELSALTANLRTIIADGNSSAARSLRARAQLRDRYGRWIEMGRGARFKVGQRGVPGGGRWVHGVIVGSDIPSGRVHVQTDDGKVVSVPSKKLEQPKAIIGLKGGKDERAARARFTPKAQNRKGAASDPADFDPQRQQSANERDDAAVEAMERLHDDAADVATRDPGGMNLLQLAHGANARQAVADAKAAGSDRAKFNGNQQPFPADGPKVDAAVADLEAIQTAIDTRMAEVLPPQDELDAMSDEDRKKAYSDAFGKVGPNLAGLYNDRKDDEAKELRRAPAVREEDLEEVDPNASPAGDDGPASPQEVVDAANDAFNELAKRVPDNSPLAGARDRIKSQLDAANEKFLADSSDTGKAEYNKSLDSIKRFADDTEPDEPGRENSAEEQAFGSFAEDIHDVHQANGGEAETSPAKDEPADEAPVTPADDGDDGSGGDEPPTSEDSADAAAQRILDEFEPEIARFEGRPEAETPEGEEHLAGLRDIVSAVKDGQSSPSPEAAKRLRDAFDAYDANVATGEDDSDPLADVRKDVDTVASSFESSSPEPTDAETPADLPEGAENAENYKEPAQDGASSEIDAAWEAHSKAAGSFTDAVTNDEGETFEFLGDREDDAAWDKFNGHMDQWHELPEDKASLTQYAEDIQAAGADIADRLLAYEDFSPEKVEQFRKDVDDFAARVRDAADAAPESEAAPEAAPEPPEAPSAEAGDLPKLEDFQREAQAIRDLSRNNSLDEIARYELDGVANMVMNAGTLLQGNRINPQEAAEALQQAITRGNEIFDTAPEGLVGTENEDKLNEALDNVEAIRTKLADGQFDGQMDEEVPAETDLPEDVPVEDFDPDEVVPEDAEAPEPETPADAATPLPEDLEPAKAVVEESLNSSPDDSVIEEAIPEALDAKKEVDEAAQAVVEAEDAPNAAEALEAWFDGVNRYRDRLEAAKENPANDDTEAVADGEIDRLDEAEAAAEEVMAPDDYLALFLGAIEERNVQGMIADLRNREEPIAGVLADGLEARIVNGERLTPNDVQAIHQMLDAMAAQPDLPDEERADLTAVKDALDPENAPDPVADEALRRLHEDMEAPRPEGTPDLPPAQTEEDDHPEAEAPAAEEEAPEEDTAELIRQLRERLPQLPPVIEEENTDWVQPEGTLAEWERELLGWQAGSVRPVAEDGAEDSWGVDANELREAIEAAEAAPAAPAEPTEVPAESAEPVDPQKRLDDAIRAIDMAVEWEDGLVPEQLRDEILDGRAAQNPEEFLGRVADYYGDDNPLVKELRDAIAGAPAVPEPVEDEPEAEAPEPEAPAAPEPPAAPPVDENGVPTPNAEIEDHRPLDEGQLANIQTSIDELRAAGHEVPAGVLENALARHRAGEIPDYVLNQAVKNAMDLLQAVGVGPNARGAMGAVRNRLAGFQAAIQRLMPRNQARDHNLPELAWERLDEEMQRNDADGRGRILDEISDADALGWLGRIPEMAVGGNRKRFELLPEVKGANELLAEAADLLGRGEKSTAQAKIRAAVALFDEALNQRRNVDVADAFKRALERRRRAAEALSARMDRREPRIVPGGNRNQGRHIFERNDPNLEVVAWGKVVPLDADGNPAGNARRKAGMVRIGDVVVRTNANNYGQVARIVGINLRLDTDNKIPYLLLEEEVRPGEFRIVAEAGTSARQVVPIGMFEGNHRLANGVDRPMQPNRPAPAGAPAAPAAPAPEPQRGRDIDLDRVRNPQVGDRVEVDLGYDLTFDGQKYVSDDPDVADRSPQLLANFIENHPDRYVFHPAAPGQQPAAAPAAPAAPSPGVVATPAPSFNATGNPLDQRIAAEAIKPVDQAQIDAWRADVWGDQADDMAAARENLASAEFLLDPNTSEADKRTALAHIIGAGTGRKFGKLGYTIDLTGVQTVHYGTRYDRSSAWQVTGIVRDANGDGVGSVSRLIEVARDASGATKVHVHNAYMRFPDDKSRGSGFATAFNGNLETWAAANHSSQEHGPLFTINATLETGAYVWTKFGFRFDPEVGRPNDQARQWIDRVEAGLTVNERRQNSREQLQIKALRDMIAAGKEVLPLHIMAIGHVPPMSDHNNDNWAGKRTFLKYSDRIGWNGVKDIRPGEVETAERRQWQRDEREQSADLRERIQDPRYSMAAQPIADADADKMMGHIRQVLSNDPKISKRDVAAIEDVVRNNRSVSVLPKRVKSALQTLAHGSMNDTTAGQPERTAWFGLNRALAKDRNADRPPGDSLGLGEELRAGTSYNRNTRVWTVPPGWRTQNLIGGINPTIFAVHEETGEKFLLKHETPHGEGYGTPGKIEQGVTQLLRRAGFVGVGPVQTSTNPNSPGIFVQALAGKHLGAEVKTSSMWNGHDRLEVEKFEDPGQIIEMLVLDTLIGNRDRHDGNFMIGRNPEGLLFLTPIDHTINSADNNRTSDQMRMYVRGMRGRNNAYRMLDDLLARFGEAGVRAMLESAVRDMIMAAKQGNQGYDIPSFPDDILKLAEMINVDLGDFVAAITNQARPPRV